MKKPRLPWQQELTIIDDTMKAISGIADPEELVRVYWNGVGRLMDMNDYVAVSRRGEESPHYLVTRSSRFVEHFNPWTQHEKLPRMSGGILGDVAFAKHPIIIEDLPSKLAAEIPRI